MRQVEDQERGIAQPVPVEPSIHGAHRLEVAASSPEIAGPDLADPNFEETPAADLDVDYAPPPPEPADPDL